MALFEDYRPGREVTAEPIDPRDLVSRPMLLSDIPEVADIEAAREGGSASGRAAGLERGLSWCDTTAKA